MASEEYYSAFDLVLDWKDAQDTELSPEQHVEMATTEAEIAAYTGRGYEEIRLDIARCAVARLTELQPVVTDNVTPIRPSRAAVFAATKYIATSSPVGK